MEEVSIDYAVERACKELEGCKSKVMMIGVAGKTGSGKSHFCELLRNRLGAVIIRMDDYYHSKKERVDDNFDDPRNQNLGLIEEHLLKLRSGKEIVKPVYNFGIETSVSEERVKPTGFIILEGLWSLDERFLELYDLKIYVGSSRDKRFKRRLKRDMEARGIAKERVMRGWNDAEKMAGIYVRPTKEYADFVVINL